MFGIQMQNVINLFLFRTTYHLSLKIFHELYKIKDGNRRFKVITFNWCYQRNARDSYSQENENEEVAYYPLAKQNIPTTIVFLFLLAVFIINLGLLYLVIMPTFPPEVFIGTSIFFFSFFATFVGFHNRVSRPLNLRCTSIFWRYQAAIWAA